MLYSEHGKKIVKGREIRMYETYLEGCFLTGGSVLRNLRQTSTAATIRPTAAQTNDIVIARCLELPTFCLSWFLVSTGLSSSSKWSQYETSLRTRTAKVLCPDRKQKCNQETVMLPSTPDIICARNLKFFNFSSQGLKIGTDKIVRCSKPD